MDVSSSSYIDVPRIDLTKATASTRRRTAARHLRSAPPVMVVVLLIFAGMALAEKRREKKRAKKALVDARYRELETETARRMSRTLSGNVIGHSDADDDDDALDDGERPPMDEYAGSTTLAPPPPPAYEDVVQDVAPRSSRRHAKANKRGSGLFHRKTSDKMIRNG